MKTNKQFFILIAIGVIVVGIIIYFIQSKSTKPQTTPSPIFTTTQIQKVFDKKVLFPVLDRDGQNILYFKANEQEDLAFYKFNLETKQESKISDNLDMPDNIIWSPNRDKVVLKVIYNKYIFEKLNSVFADSSLQDKQETTWLYDLNTKKISRLNLNIQNIAWFDNDLIVYYLYELENNTNAIFLANANGSNWKKIKDIDYTDGIGLFAIPPQEVYYFPILYEPGANNIYKLDIETKQNSEIVNNKTAGQILSVSKDKILYQIANEEENNFTLGVINKDGSEKKDFNLAANINKVTFSEKGNFVIIAIQEQNQTNDMFYKINLKSNQIEQLKYEFQINIDAQNLFISKNDKTLYFTSDDILYGLQIP